MQFSLDDGKTWKTVTGIRVIHSLPGVGDVETAEVAFNFTQEGLITDVWVDDVCEGTSSETYQEIGDRLVNGG